MKEQDQELAERVRRALRGHEQSIAPSTVVECRDGVVRLSGMVDVLSERLAAEEEARRIPGVRDVENGLTIAVDGQITDKHIELELMDRLRGNPEFDRIGVKVNGGVVTLVGEADNLRVERQAREEAASTRGVREVKSQVRVDNRRDDVSIMNDINRFLAATDIYLEASVQDGTVRLRGAVADEDDRRYVEEMVIGLPGVQRLLNELEIES